jgi:hypothetical protein
MVDVRSIAVATGIEAGILGLITGGAVGVGVLGEAAFHPEIGDNKDYSGVVDTYSSLGLGIGAAYLGLKYGSKAVRGIQENMLIRQKTSPTVAKALLAVK